ncbi:unnamed protein product [Enterobius vermicularis]|uniref:Transposase n=1 Tax=Enterobius vermicularis TaxID=51028 RepID=A0A0N4V5F8_ENTVE|nr:unnamed protein product [Enterobius vermicularis]
MSVTYRRRIGPVIVQAICLWSSKSGGLSVKLLSMRVIRIWKFAQNMFEAQHKAVLAGLKTRVQYMYELLLDGYGVTAKAIFTVPSRQWRLARLIIEKGFRILNKALVM